MAKDYLDLEKLEQGDSPFKIRWTAKSRSSMIAPSVIVGGALVVADANGTVISTNIETGKRLWTTKLDLGCIREPLQFVDGKIWFLGTKGGAPITGLSPDDGSISAQYYIPDAVKNAVRHDQNVFCYEHKLIFMHQIKRMKVGWDVLVPYQCDLKTGEMTPLVDGPIVAGEIRDMVPSPDGVSCLIVRNSTVEKYSLSDKQKTQTWEIPAGGFSPDRFGNVGFAAFRNGWAVVRPAPTKGLLHLRTTYPGPGVIAMGDQVQTLPYDLYASEYYINAVDLPDRSFVAIGTLVLQIANGQLATSALLPGGSITFSKGSGLFLLGTKIITFQSFSRGDGAFMSNEKDRYPPEDCGYYLQPFSFDPNTLQFAPMGIALKISPEGKNFFSPEIDQFGSNFVFRGDSRFHFVSLPSAA